MPDNDRLAQYEMLRHFLATLAYRVTKTLRDAPEDFAGFRVARGVRTPHELICHITNVLGYGRTHFIGGCWQSRVPTDFDADVRAFHQMLEGLSGHLKNGAPLLDTTPERLLQGPFADAMTHAGQLAMLRRLAGAPIRPENFILAAIEADNVSPQQPAAERRTRSGRKGRRLRRRSRRRVRTSRTARPNDIKATERFFDCVARAVRMTTAKGNSFRRLPRRRATPLKMTA